MATLEWPIDGGFELKARGFDGADAARLTQCYHLWQPLGIGTCYSICLPCFPLLFQVAPVTPPPRLIVFTIVHYTKTQVVSRSVICNGIVGNVNNMAAKPF